MLRTKDHLVFVGRQLQRLTRVIYNFETNEFEVENLIFSTVRNSIHLFCREFEAVEENPDYFGRCILQFGVGMNFHFKVPKVTTEVEYFGLFIVKDAKLSRYFDIIEDRYIIKPFNDKLNGIYVWDMEKETVFPLRKILLSGWTVNLPLTMKKSSPTEYKFMGYYSKPVKKKFSMTMDTAFEPVVNIKQTLYAGNYMDDMRF